VWCGSPPPMPPWCSQDGYEKHHPGPFAKGLRHEFATLRRLMSSSGLVVAGRLDDFGQLQKYFQSAHGPPELGMTPSDLDHRVTTYGSVGWQSQRLGGMQRLMAVHPNIFRSECGVLLVGTSKSAFAQPTESGE